MDTRIIELIASLSVLSRIEADNIKIHIPVKRTTAITGKTVTIVVSQSEPYDITLPDNVLWACFDGTSSMYKKLYRRISRLPTDETQHTWQLVTEYEGVYEEQFYAEGEEPSTGITLATIQAHGIMTLSGAPADPLNPVVVSANDPRNTDARNPLPHDEMHPNLPAEQLIHDDGVVNITAGIPVAGSVLFGTSESPTTYQRMALLDICEAMPVMTEPADPSTLTKLPRTGELLLGTAVQKYNGYAVGTTLDIVATVFGKDENENGFREFLGYFSPSSMTLNGVSVTECVIAAGNNRLVVTIEAPTFPALILTANLKGV